MAVILDVTVSCCFQLLVATLHINYNTFVRCRAHDAGRTIAIFIIVYM